MDQGVDHRTWKAALAGAYLGYFILQPIGMIVSNMLFQYQLAPEGSVWTSLVYEFLMSYSFETLSWGMVFILLGTAIGLFYAKVVQETEFKLEKAYDIVHESEEKFRTIFEGINDMVLYVDKGGKIVDINKRGEDILGIRRDEIIGKNFAKLGDIGFKDIQNILDLFKAPLVEGRTVNPVEMELSDKDGNKIIVEASTQLIKNSEKTQGVVTILRDVTERTKARETLQQAYQELKSVDNLKTDIIASVSHELRTPITVLKTTLEMLKDEKNEQVRGDLLKMAINALERENWIIEDLITTAHIHAGDLELIPSPVDIASILEDALKVVQPKAESKSVTFAIKIDEIPNIVADARRMTNVVVHILDNAVKFNKEGGLINIVIRDLGDEIEVSVSDEGIGMEIEDMDTIFQPLTQLDHSANRKFGGTGTGLSVSKHILEAHGGKIWAESEGLDKGCIFRFSLPLKKEDKNENYLSSG